MDAEWQSGRRNEYLALRAFLVALYPFIFTEVGGALICSMRELSGSEVFGVMSIVENV